MAPMIDILQAASASLFSLKARELAMRFNPRRTSWGGEPAGGRGFAGQEMFQSTPHLVEPRFGAEDIRRRIETGAAT